MMKNKIKRATKRTIIWSLNGFIIGLLLGMILFGGFIKNYTNKCMDAYEDCRDKYNNLTSGYNSYMVPNFNPDEYLRLENITFGGDDDDEG